MWKFSLICKDFRIFYALKNLEIRINPENTHACEVQQMCVQEVCVAWKCPYPQAQ